MFEVVKMGKYYAVNSTAFVFLKDHTKWHLNGIYISKKIAENYAKKFSVVLHEFVERDNARYDYVKQYLASRNLRFDN